MSRSLAPMARVGLVSSGLHYGREGGLPTTTARGASPERAARRTARVDRDSLESCRMAFSPGRDARGGDVVPAASEIASRLIDGGFHI